MKFIKYTFYLYLCFIISFVSTKSLLKQTPSSIHNKIVLQNNSLLSCIDTCVHGQCITNNTVCQCNEGYITEETNKSNMKCTYKQKSQLTAFLLEAFTFIGGDIYLNNIQYVIIKSATIISITILFSFNIPCGLFGIKLLMNKDCSPCSCIKLGTTIVSVIVLLIWTLSDIMMILNERAIDANNVPLLYMFNK